MMAGMDTLADHRIWPDRFAAKVLIGDPNECWPWKAVLIPGGYGQFWHEGSMRNAHRMALLLGGVSIPEDHVVLHKCDNRNCCNPAHLLSASQAENMRDMVQKGRSLRGQRHNQAKLTETDVLAIRASKRTAQQEADRYGVARATIHDIRQRLSWTHLV